MNFFLLSLALLCTSSDSAKFGSQSMIRFTSAKCTSTLKSAATVKCYVKAYSRKNTTLNVQVNLTRPLFSINMRYDLNYKVLSNSYRSIINSTFDVCVALNGTASNPIITWMIGFMSPNFKELLHACPYKGFQNFSNLYVDPTGFVSKFSAGHYMTFITFWDSFDENVVRLKYTQDLISGDHEDF